MVLFTTLVLVGLAQGLARGGDFRAAMFEVRPLLYIPIVYFLAKTLCEEPAHERRLIWSATVAVFVQTLLSLNYLLGLDVDRRDDLETLTEHGSSIGMAMVFVFCLTSLMYRGVSGRQRMGLVVMSVPVIWVFLVSQRRAAVITLAAALILLGVCLFWRQRRTFWLAVPVVSLVTVAYLGAFWNSDTTIGFPAQAMKTVIAPEQLDEADQSSDLYRILENLDVHATIRAEPVLGLGFGQRFYRPYPLPDISSFEFNGYLPHISFLWIWIKTGFFGIATMIYLIGRSIMLGSHRIRALPNGPDAVIATTAVLFLVMYTIYTYVDIGWDSRNMVLFGVTLSIATSELTRPEEPDREMSGAAPASLVAPT
jgi:hypothetical protein